MSLRNCYCGIRLGRDQSYTRENENAKERNLLAEGSNGSIINTYATGTRNYDFSR